MIAFTTEKEVNDSIKLLCEEIFPHIEASGKINVHINQVYLANLSKEDFIRQSFIFFTLCKVKYFFSDLIEDDLLENIFLYIKNNYQTSTTLTDLEKKYIEVYTIRGLVFLKKDFSFFLTRLIESNFHLIYTTPILLHIFLATEADALKYLGKSIMPPHYLNIAKEAVFFSLKSNQKDTNKAFHYVDIFYYDDILGLSFKSLALDLVETKIRQELKNVSSIYTSVLAKMFEGYAALNSLEKMHFFESLCSKRGVGLNPYLVDTYQYTGNTISEIDGTSYVCLDAYAHLILGLLVVYKNKYEI